MDLNFPVFFLRLAYGRFLDISKTFIKRFLCNLVFSAFRTLANANNQLFQANSDSFDRFLMLKMFKLRADWSKRDTSMYTVKQILSNLKKKYDHRHLLYHFNNT